MIFITGASKGIGKFLLKKFISDGKEVYGTYNTTKPIEYSDNYFQVNIEDENSIINWVQSINNKDNIVLINCAGINYNAFAHKSDTEKWEDVIKINLLGTFNVIKSFLPEMRREGYGRIINLSSVVGQIGVPGTSAYAASKSGLEGLTKTIAIENAENGITINNLNLGYFDIGIIEQVPNKMKDKMMDRIPNKRFGDPNEIYLAIKFLIDCGYINGTHINLNGGLY